MKYIVRNAGAGDLAAVYKFICVLEETSFNHAGFSDIFLENIGSSNCIYLVAEDKGKAIGFASCHMQNLLHHTSRVAEIQELFVDDTYRGQGIGRLLVKELIQRATAAGCVLLEVTAQNKRVATHAFYEQAGFLASHKKFTLHLADTPT